jgi:uncharacterized membrane protein
VTDAPPEPAVSAPAPAAAAEDPRTMVLVAYGLFIGGFIVPFLPIAGVILAYIKKKDVVGTIWATHYRNLIQTFWIGLIASLIALVLMFVLIGMLVMVAVVVWYLYRLILGAVKAIEHKAFSPLMKFERDFGGGGWPEPEGVSPNWPSPPPQS